jgi:hypothetical protein
LPGPVFDVICELGTPCGGPGLAKARYYDMYFIVEGNQKAQKYYFDLF